MEKKYMIDNIETIINDKEMSEKSKVEIIQQIFLAIILETSGQVKKYAKMRILAPTKKANECIDGIIGGLGNLLKAHLRMWRTYGADYRGLVSILNADFSKCDEIKRNGDTEKAFDELILQYGLAKDNYPEIDEALRLAK